jgi:hypothetical protein
MSKKQILTADGESALADLQGQLPTAVRYLLQQIEKDHRGGTVELRVPPFGAVQCIEGMNHRRGTPPNVVELTSEVFLALCAGEMTINQARLTPGCNFSGEKAAELAKVFPVGS